MSVVSSPVHVRATLWTVEGNAPPIHLIPSPQGGGDSGEDMMKLATCGKPICLNFAFLIDNPELDPSWENPVSLEPRKVSCDVYASAYLFCCVSCCVV
jgi:hypothetical protein